MTARATFQISTVTAGMLVALSFNASCTCTGSSRRDVAPEGEARTLLLDGGVPFAELDVPPDSRGNLGPPPERIPLRHFEQGQGDGGANAVTDLPIRTRNLYFFKPSPGMKVVRADGTEVPHKYYQPQGAYWTYDEHRLRIHGWQGIPADGELFLVYPTATSLEAGLNLKFSGKPSAAEFARTLVQAGPESRSGLLLPAPGKASWDIEVPPSADLRFSTALIRPEVADGAPSDGAQIRVTVTVDGSEQELAAEQVKGDQFRPIRVDLGRFARQKVRLTVTTDPGATARYDYVFLADPVVASRKAQPRRVFMIFVDTLRPDHVGAFGYARDTTPALDALAAGAVKFTQARNVAPWTLPSTRSILTGNDPEYYFDSRTLQGILRESGYATAMFAGNLYLSSNFGLNRDWGLHFVELLPRANKHMDRALGWLEQQQDRDVLMLLQFMDCHLPYEEPEEYRNMFAGTAPETLKRDSFHREHVIAANLKTKEDRQYIRDRYDNNIRFVDDQLSRLYDLLQPGDIVVFFSDHGEEFWEHGGYEHGHSLFDELLRVPLVIEAEGLTPSAVDTPVSLLDVVPTILDLLGLPPSETKGRSLVPLIRGEPAAKEYFAGRPQAFGRPLYGGERWGALDDNKKYMTFEGRESIFDLASDPGEKKETRKDDDAAAAQMRAALQEALTREVVPALRLAAKGSRKFPTAALTAIARVPGGIRAAWVGEDPTEASMAQVEFTAGSDTATFTWPVGYRGSRDVWLVPNRPLAEVTHQLKVEATEGDATASLSVAADKPGEPDGDRVVLASAKVGERALEIGFGFMAIPDPKARALSGYDPELAQQLEAMGYAVGGAQEEPPPKATAPKPPAKDDPKEGGSR